MLRQLITFSLAGRPKFLIDLPVDLHLLWLWKFFLLNSVQIYKKRKGEKDETKNKANQKSTISLIARCSKIIICALKCQSVKIQALYQFYKKCNSGCCFVFVFVFYSEFNWLYLQQTKNKWLFNLYTELVSWGLKSLCVICH